MRERESNLIREDMCKRVIVLVHSQMFQLHKWRKQPISYCAEIIVYSTVCFPQGRSLSYKTFFIWVLISMYQGN